MRRGRVVILVVLIILIIISVGAVGLIFFLNQAPVIKPPTVPAIGGVGATQPPSSSGGGGEVTATPTYAILRAAQPMLRGAAVITEAVQAVPWPTNLVPDNAVTDTAKIVGKRARISIQPGEPILSTMLLSGIETPSWTGSDAAVEIPAGKVAISLPYDSNNGVALGLKDGDHVALIVSWRLVNLDQAWQSALPNNLGTLTIPKEGGAPGETTNLGGTGPLGRMTPVPGGGPVYVIPSELEQRFRLVTQVILQDAIVLHMGRFGPNEPLVIVPTPTLVPNATPPTAVPPSPTPVPPRILTLVVDPKDALAINYINRVAEKYPDAVQLTLVLRSASDQKENGMSALAETLPVTQQYMFENFGMVVPNSLDYGVWGTPVAPTPVPPQP